MVYSTASSEALSKLWSFTSLGRSTSAGLISAADMEKSNATIHPNGPAMYDVDFDGLTIDNNKTNGMLFFRLAESTNAIIVHQQVKDMLIEKGFNDLAFYETEKVAL